jgi:hypothetical protein
MVFPTISGILRASSAMRFFIVCLTKTTDLLAGPLFATLVIMRSCTKWFNQTAGLVVAFVLAANFDGRAGAASFTWDPSPDAATGKVLGYKFYYSTQSFTSLPTDAATNPIFTVLTVTTGTSVNVTNLVDGQKYFMAVTAFGDNSQESPPSNILSYTAAATSVTGTLANNGTASFVWDPSPDAATGKVVGYKFYYSTQSFTSIPADVATNPTFTILTVTTGTSVSLTNLITGQTYFMAVTAFSADNQESPPSNILSYTFGGGAVTKPRPPSNVTVQ